MILSFNKRTDDEQRLLVLIDKLEKKVQQAFLDFIQENHSQITVREVNNLLGQGRIEDALDLITDDSNILGIVLPLIFFEAGAVVSQIFSRRLNVRNIPFDPTALSATEIARNNRLEFVRNFTQEQRNTATQAISRGIQQGMPENRVALEFVNSIGLTQRQDAAVDNYRKLLQEGSKEALDRKLRDRRHDSAVANAKEKPLTDKQIEIMVDRYRQKYLFHRAKVIARTEATRAINQASMESLKQIIAMTGIDPSRIRRTWIDMHDERTRNHHFSMHNQTVGYNQPFEDGLGNLLMYPGDPSAPPVTTVNCRCIFTVSLT